MTLIIKMDEGYEDNEILELEICDDDGKKSVSVPYRPIYSSEKRLICFSIINKSECNYNNNCTYAHSVSEQKIDEDRLFSYKIIFDENVMNFVPEDNSKVDDTYRNLLLSTTICSKCLGNSCTGGYNCRNGIYHPSIKVCKSDLLTGDCVNNETEIIVDEAILNKIGCTASKYIGCANGHHLTKRGLVPYYTYVHQSESSKRKTYNSTRIIQPMYMYETPFKDQSEDSLTTSSDEEINSWFKENNFNDN